MFFFSKYFFLSNFCLCLVCFFKYINTFCWCYYLFPLVVFFVFLFSFFCFGMFLFFPLGCFFCFSCFPFFGLVCFFVFCLASFSLLAKYSVDFAQQKPEKYSLQGPEGNKVNNDREQN